MSLSSVSGLADNPGPVLTARFRAIGLTRDYVRAMTERGDDLRNPLTPTRAALFSDDDAAIALRLFFCREAFPPDAAGACLGRALLDALLACGLLIETGPGMLASPFHMRIVRDLYLFSDYLGQDRDAVMGAGETTAILFRASRPARQARRALDLGCGAGTLALLLAAQAEEAVGTDINPRAIALARCNASVNGIDNAAFRCGDVWEPVSGESFDLIVSQPPYYPNALARGTAGDQVFLHGGERGDELPLRVVAGIPEHLTSPGRAVVFTSWPEDREPAAPDALRVLELRTNRRELHGTRQCIDVIEHARPGEGWTATFEVAADSWGTVDTPHIDAILRAEELLREPRERLLDARLRMPEGTVPFREGSQMLLACPPESLIGLTAVDDRTWEVISAIHSAQDVRSGIAALDSAESALTVVEHSLRRGLLTL